MGAEAIGCTISFTEAIFCEAGAKWLEGLLFGSESLWFLGQGFDGVEQGVLEGLEGNWG
jgi:hypothetical protein